MCTAGSTGQNCVHWQSLHRREFDFVEIWKERSTGPCFRRWRPTDLSNEQSATTKTFQRKEEREREKKGEGRGRLLLEKRTDLQNSVKLIDVTSAWTKRVEVQKLHEDGTDAPDVNSGVVVPRTEKQLGCAVPACRHLVRHVPAAWCSGPALTTRGMHAIRTFARHKGGAAAGVILLLAQSLRPRKAKVRDLQFVLGVSSATSFFLNFPYLKVHIIY